MITSFSKLFLRTLRENPADAEVASHQLMVRAGYIRRAAPGIYTWLPLGLRVLRKIENVVREEMVRAGGQEVHFPALLPREPYEATNRWTEYGPSLFRIKDRRDNDYLLAPTHEEMFTILVKDMYSSYRDLPLTLFQLQTKYRDEARPRAGVIRGREFVMKDSYSFDIDDAGLERSYNNQREAYQRIFTRIGLDYVICSAMSGAMGGSRSEEFLHPSEIGEDTFVCSAGGYAANVEAVTTVVPPAEDASLVPACHLEMTPDAATIAKLVDCANTNFPRDDRPWQGSDTLKIVVLSTINPLGEKALLAVGIPGDREIDMARVNASLAPLEAEPASDEDIREYPQLVKGYIGPDALQAAGIRFLVDPRVVPGTRWITGGNKFEYHMFDYVYGRDFKAEGTIEAAEVKAGDIAPDGSGPLQLARGIEIGHIFQLGRKYAKALGITVLDENGVEQVVTMGSYGIGVSRLMAALAQKYHDEYGLKWPKQVAPFDVQLVVAGKGDELSETANQLAQSLDEAGLEVLLDDRPKVSAGVKFKDAELLGVPFIVVVGRGVADGVVELRNRATGERQEVAVSELCAQVEKIVQAE